MFKSLPTSAAPSGLLELTLVKTELKNYYETDLLWPHKDA